MSDTFKVFVSLPMRGIETEKIRARQKEIFDRYRMPGWELMNTCDEDPNAEEDNRLWYLGRSIQMLGNADVVIFAKDWRLANGCIIEHLVAHAYDILCVYEDDGID